LTSSTDWTVKLWKRSKASNEVVINKCIASFDSAQDYVYDVKWSPTNPSVFTSVDGGGHVNVFNINVSDIPIASYTPEQGRALNKLEWSHDSKNTASGSVDGVVYVHDLSKV
jgi:dynein intermediate chain